jgi:hypothetical protein
MSICDRYLVCSWIFVHGSWFGLHFAEGHIPFGSMQLLPMLFYLAMESHRISRLLTLLVSIAVIVLDGGIYAIIFAAFGILSLLLAGKIPVRAIFAAMRRDLIASAGMAVGAILLMMPKIYPVVSSIGGRIPQLDYFQMPFDLIKRSLFDPSLNLMEVSRRLDGTPYWRMHEFGCYLSWIGLVMIMFAVVRHKVYRTSCGFALVIAIFWLWVGSGALPAVNPWTLFHHLPLVNNAHVQSRLFIISFVFFCLLIGLVLSRLQHRRTIWLGLALVLVAESIIVRNLPMWIRPYQYEPMVGWRDLIRRPTIDRTIGELAWTPRHYLAAENIGSSSAMNLRSFL